MIFRRDATADSLSPQNDRITEDDRPGFERRAPLPFPPLQWSAQLAGEGVRITIVNDGPLGPRLNGAVEYHVCWAEDIDETTAEGKRNGFAQTVTLAPAIPATGIDHTQSSALYADPKYKLGWFYIVGVDRDGNRSAPSEPAQIVTTTADTTLPGNVLHPQVSESGVVHNGTVFSELSIDAVPPEENRANFDGVQLYLKDYLSLGDTQEGFFQKWNGSGGISFAVTYPIPRRRSSVSVTATNGMAAVSAAGGLLSVARAGEQFELLGQKILIDAITDTQITLASNWPRPDITTTDYVIIGKPTIYLVSVSKSGSRRADIENAPSKAVLMDGEISPPNYPATITAGKAGVAVRIAWTQVSGSTISHYNLYRSDAVDTGMWNSPPRPASTTMLIHREPHNPNLVAGAEQQFDDTNFTLYDLETNAEFYWYVTTTNIRGDESDANYLSDNCRTAGGNEIDPTVPGGSYGKNFLFNAGFGGTAAAAVLATAGSGQDAFNGTDATNLPGVPYGVTTAQANGTGALQGHTRWEADDAASGAAGTVLFQNGDECHIPAPGAGKIWYVVQEIGAWGDGTQVFRKIGPGEVYTVSFFFSHNGAAVDGAIYVNVEQYDNNTYRGVAKRRYRDSNSVIQTDSSPLTVVSSDIVATPARYQASFQTDTTIGVTKQLRISVAWSGGTTGTLVVRRAMVNNAERAAAWSLDMGDTTVSIPVPAGTPIPPVNDRRTERRGDGWVLTA